jgi:ribosomal-protein-alanine N-acetyltransferase
VRPSNRPALGLYQRLGFATVGLRKGYYPADQGQEDAVVMRLEL